MPVNKEAIAHFERLGRAIARTRVIEPLPRTGRYVIDQMKKIDVRSGMGTDDFFDGDLASHVAYIEFREAWVKKKGGRGETD